MIKKDFLVRCGVGIALAAALVFPALAHEVFEAAEPAAGAILKASPPSLTVRFIEPVKPVRATLRTAAGADVPLSAVAGNEQVDVLVVPLSTPLPPGAYVFEWLVKTIDFHPASGSIPFTVTGP